MATVTWQKAFEDAHKARNDALRDVYQHQTSSYRHEALNALHDVILPWWKRFIDSKTGAKVGLLLEQDLYRPQISENVAYVREDGKDWEAHVIILGEPRNLRLEVEQYRDRQPPRSWTGAMFAHGQRRRIPLENLSSYSLDLHPIILIDFAEQIEAKVVKSRIQLILEGRFPQQ